MFIKWVHKKISGLSKLGNIETYFLGITPDLSLFSRDIFMMRSSQSRRRWLYAFVHLPEMMIGQNGVKNNLMIVFHYESYLLYAIFTDSKLTWGTPPGCSFFVQEREKIIGRMGTWTIIFWYWCRVESRGGSEIQITDSRISCWSLWPKFLGPLISSGSPYSKYFLH